MLMLSIRRQLELVRLVSDKTRRQLLNTSLLGARGSLNENFPTDVHRELFEENLEVGKKVHRRSNHENFLTDVLQKLLNETFGIWRRSPSKIAPRKFPNRFATRIARRRNWKVGEEVYRRSLHESFPTDVRRESLDENLEVGEDVHQRSLHENFSTGRCASRIARRKLAGLICQIHWKRINEKFVKQ